MGFKSAKKSNGSYKEDNLIFPSRFVYSTIASIDRNLRILYSPSINNEFWATIRYSPVRDDEEEFEAILDRVEERINRINGKVKIRETTDAAFNQLFMGIIDFLYEASDFEDNTDDVLAKSKTPEYIKKRFIDLTNRLWEMGISPSEF